MGAARRTLTLIIAPTFAVARLVAEQEKLPDKDWYFAHDPLRVMGYVGSHVEAIMAPGPGVTSQMLDVMSYLSQHGIKTRTVRT